jgi:hypothetical protein
MNADWPRVPTMMSIRLWAVGLLALGLLMGVFMLYTDPTFLVLLANQVWTCF